RRDRDVGGRIGEVPEPGHAVGFVDLDHRHLRVARRALRDGVRGRRPGSPDDHRGRRPGRWQGHRRGAPARQPAHLGTGRAGPKGTASGTRAGQPVRYGWRVARAVTRTWYRIALGRPGTQPLLVAAAGEHMGVAIAAAERHAPGAFA